MARHIVFVAIGSAGDVHPFAVIATALKRRGHRVSFMANGHFRPLAERLGLDFVELGSDADFQCGMQDPLAWDARRGFATVWKYVEPSIGASFDWIEANIDRDTILVASTLALGARVARDAFKLPLVTAHLAPVTLLSALDPPRVGPRLFPEGTPSWLARSLLWLGDKSVLDPLTAPAVNQLRRRAGLEPVDHIMTRYLNSPDRVLLLFPEWFAADPGDWPPHEHAGFPLFDEQGLHALPNGLEEFLSQGDRPLLFTPGSAMQHAHRFFENAVAACRDLGRRGIVVTRYTEQLPHLPPFMLQLGYVPFSQLLSRVDLVSYHGGIGTCSQTLAAGVPHLIVPNAHDQFDNARRIERLGVGRSVSKQANARTFTRTIAELLRDPETGERCRRWQAAIEAPQTVVDKACAHIENARFGS